jgi:endonuclease/exonuclease/phosphatase family metal-dependent hydrolase
MVLRETRQTSVEKPGKPGATLKQVYNVVAIKPTDGGEPFAIVGLHLKSTKTQEGEEIRVTQMNEIMELLNERFSDYAVLMCADFNGSLVPMADKKGNEIKPMAVNVAVKAGYQSLYAKVLGEDPLWTSWKTRAGKTFKYTIDYILGPDAFKPKAVLGLVPEDMVPEHHFPNYRSASDHLSLVCDLEVATSPNISHTTTCCCSLL